ncbi:MAG: hypothetical protein PHO37_01265 [Kiritimatiellae bacterium]|nr:hypothetical protein [Kiritimatiellia bacterium]
MGCSFRPPHSGGHTKAQYIRRYAVDAWHSISAAMRWMLGTVYPPLCGGCVAQYIRRYAVDAWHSISAAMRWMLES